MEDQAPGPSRPGGKPDWFLGWLREVFLPAQKDPVTSQLEVFQDAFEKLPDIEESVRKTLTNTLTNEARISLAREDDKTQIAKLLKSQSILVEKEKAQMPWDQKTEAETKIISRAVESLKEQDFSTKSLKFWRLTIPISTTNFLSLPGLEN